MGHWEYRSHRVFRHGITSEGDSLAALNKLGAQGWELVAVIPDGTTSGGGTAILKRRIEA